VTPSMRPVSYAGVIMSRSAVSKNIFKIVFEELRYVLYHKKRGPKTSQ